ncbi:MAG TPA: MlaD family protein [Solirubrobacterales bacterium]|nr:MlaD family protein [Solirubrobacterales bacterium]
MLVGAVTTLIAVVGVFLSYNANLGLPFVPTYQINAELPSGSNLVRGNEVRIAGVRVGIIKSVKPEQLEDGRAIANLDLALDKSVQPIPEDSTLIVRQRSAIGLKYLLLTPGKSDEGLKPGGTIPLKQARPESVDQDDFFNMFQKPVRESIQHDLAEYGGMFAARGESINEILGQLPPLLELAEPVARNLSSEKTDLDGFIRGLSQAAAEVAPVADQQAEMFVALDTTFTALANVARPYIQESITEGHRTQLVTQTEAPRIRPFLYAQARFMKAFLPGAQALGASAPVVNSSFDVGIPVLRSSPALYDQLAPTARSLRRFGESTTVNAGLDTLIETNGILKPLLSHVAPAQSVCNYLALVLRNVADLTSTTSPGGNLVRSTAVFPPVNKLVADEFGGPTTNSEGGPASAPASNPGSISNLHYNPYPNTAAPGQSPFECEAGNQTYAAGQLSIGNVPGNQGTITEDQSAKQLKWGGNG